MNKSLRALNLYQVGKSSLLKKLVDGGAKVLPYPVEAACLACRTPTRLLCFRMKRCVVADNLKGVSLNRVEDIFEGYLGWRALKLVSTLGATNALDNLSLAQALEDLLGVWQIYPLALSYLRCSDRKLSIIFCEVEGAQDSALSPFRDSHTPYHGTQRRYSLLARSVPHS